MVSRFEIQTDWQIIVPYTNVEGKRENKSFVTTIEFNFGLMKRTCGPVSGTLRRGHEEMDDIPESGGLR